MRFYISRPDPIGAVEEYLQALVGRKESRTVERRRWVVDSVDLIPRLVPEELGI